MITKEYLQKQITDCGEKRDQYITAVNQEIAKISFCEQMIQEIDRIEAAKDVGDGTEE